MARRKTTFAPRHGHPWLWLLAALAVLLVAGVVALPVLVPPKLVEEQVVAAVKRATGRDLDIRGGLSLSVLSGFGVTARDVSLSNPSWAGNKPMASFDGLTVRVKLAPLLHRRIEVDSLDLDKPHINLVVDRQGHVNWSFEKPEAAAPAEGQSPPEGQPPAETTPPPSAEAPPPAEESQGFQVVLGQVGIHDGRIVYSNARTGQNQALEAVNLRLSVSNLDSPLRAEGQADWRGETVGLVLEAAKARDLTQGNGTPITLRLSSDPLNLSFQGMAALAGEPKAQGDVDIGSASVKELGRWTGHPIDTAGQGALTLATKLDMQGDRLALSDIRLSLDQTKATGDLTLTSGGQRPLVKGRLDVDKLDFNLFQSADEVERPALAPAQPVAPTPAPPQGATPPKTESGWSDATFDTSALRGVDLDLGLTAGAVVFRKLEAGHSTAHVILNAGRLVVDQAEIAAYGGTVHGRLAADSSGIGLGIDTNLRLEHMQVQPLLTAAAGFNRLEGTAAMDIQVTGRGRSERELVGSLDGKGRFGLTDGVLKGIDLPGMVRNIQTAFTQPTSDEKTAISDLAGSFVISNGILHNDDLVVTATPVHLSGAGTADLPRRSLDYRLEPRLQGEGPRTTELNQILVPVRVKGPWDNLNWRPDVEGALRQQLQDPSKLLDNETVNKALPKELKKILPGLLGH